jgi:hypothetical protein
VQSYRDNQADLHPIYSFLNTHPYHAAKIGRQRTGTITGRTMNTLSPGDRDFALRPAYFTPKKGDHSQSHTPSTELSVSSDEDSFSKDYHNSSSPQTSPPPQEQTETQNPQPLTQQPSQRTMTTTAINLAWDGGSKERTPCGQFLCDLELQIEDKQYQTDDQKIKFM